MSRHQRPSSSNSTRSRIIVGSAMTAVFLSGGAGVAMADTETDSSTPPKTTSVVGDLTGTVDNTVEDVTGALDGILGDDQTVTQTGKNNTATVINGDHNTVNNNTTNNYGTKNDDKKDHKKDDHKKRDCGCPKDKKDDDDHKKDCPKERESVEHESKKKDDDDAVQGVTTVADIDDDEDVKGASVDDEEVKGASVDDYTPVGSADTGDGSFVPGIAPVASTWSTGDSMLAAGGGLAAAAMLAGAGVGMGRHRRGGTHRVSA